MNTSKNRRRCLTCALALSLIASALHAQPSGFTAAAQVGFSAQAETARRVVLQMFPELQERTVRATLGTADAFTLNQSWESFPSLAVIVSEPYYEKGSGIQTRRTLVAVEVLFDRATGRMTGLRTSGLLVNTARRTEVAARVDGHSEWSDEQVLSALREAGARFTPDAVKSAESTLGPRLAPLEPFLGTIQIRDATFQIRSADELRADLPAAELYWFVRFSATDAGRLRRFSARIEPFDGNLVSVLEQLY